jgi:hypothetical protein
MSKNELEMKSLVKAAKELNTVMCLEPKIKLIGVSKEDLEEAIEVNAEDIHWVDGVDEDGDPYEADSFSDETLAVLDALGVGDPANKVKKAPKKSKDAEIEEAENEDNVVKARAEKDKAKKAAPAPEKKTAKKPEPEDEDEDYDEITEKLKKVKVIEDEAGEENSDDLPTRLQAAKKMDDLNEIITDFPDVYTKKVVKGFAEFKNPIMLKKAMKEAAGIVPAEKVRKEKGEKVTRATVMAAILNTSIKKPMTIEEMVVVMQDNYGGSPAESKFQVKTALSYVAALGLIYLDDPKGKLSYKG